MSESLKSVAYENCVMQAPDGTEMCRCLRKRAQWYISRGLAELVSEDPFVFRLKFFPKGLGNASDPYGLAPKENRCVVCGREEALTKHHIVPHMYRRFFPETIKGRNSHDVVVICVDHHEEYESAAMEFKNQLHKQITGEMIHTRMHVIDTTAKHVSGLCRTIVNAGEKIPEDRVMAIIAELRELSVDPTWENLWTLASQRQLPPKTSAVDLPGYAVVRTLQDDNAIAAFIETWRRHFVDVMNPMFMPAHWDVQRPL